MVRNKLAGGDKFIGGDNGCEFTHLGSGNRAAAIAA